MPSPTPAGRWLVREPTHTSPITRNHHICTSSTSFTTWRDPVGGESLLDTHKVTKIGTVTLTVQIPSAVPDKAQYRSLTLTNVRYIPKHTIDGVRTNVLVSKYLNMGGVKRYTDATLRKVGLLGDGNKRDNGGGDVEGSVLARKLDNGEYELLLKNSP